MRRSMSMLVLLVMTGWLANAPLGAQTAPAGSKQSNLSPEKGKEGSSAAVSLLDQAMVLVGYARENESPVAMLTAVQMIRRVRAQEGTGRLGTKQSEAQKTSEQPKEGKKGETPTPTMDAQKLLAEAKTWAKGNEHLLALIGAEAAQPGNASGGTLGVPGGAIYHTDRVLPFRADSYTLTFRGGEVARVAVVGDGDTDLDLYVYDENGNLIGSDTDATDRCLVQFTPRWTGQFRIRITNSGWVYNQYVLMTN
jgi:hypothetical protein